jgi:hypothetical protein
MRILTAFSVLVYEVETLLTPDVESTSGSKRPHWIWTSLIAAEREKINQLRGETDNPITEMGVRRKRKERE